LEKKTVVILYEYFYPGFKAGGPVQSLINLICLLKDQYQFKVITSGYDVNAANPYENIALNQWNKMELAPGCTIPVWYGSSKVSGKTVLQAIESSAAAVVFLNCMYSFPFFLYPLLHKKKSRVLVQAKLIISPRGILMPNALSLKSFKKKYYLRFLQLSSLLKHCQWHATSDAEIASIQQNFGKNCSIFKVGNVSKKPWPAPAPHIKQQGTLRLSHLSLIAPVKNIHTLLQVVSNCTQKIELDIYGPVKDQEYWNRCLLEMQNLPNHVQVHYKQELDPFKVQETLAGYDAMILLTTGENFGHALFENMSIGRPVITSYFTPWNELQLKKAGWNVNISLPGTITALLDELAKKDTTEWEQFCRQAHAIASNYFNGQGLPEKYKQLFC